MRVLVLGASGATGKLVVQDLLIQNKTKQKKNISIRAVYRESANIPDNLIICVKMSGPMPLLYVFCFFLFNRNLTIISGIKFLTV